MGSPVGGDLRLPEAGGQLRVPGGGLPGRDVPAAGREPGGRGGGGVLSSAGITEVPVRRRPRVGVLSTGDEVVEPGVRPLPVGKIYGANLPLLLSRLRELGVENVTGRLAGDDPPGRGGGHGADAGDL